MRSGEIEDRWEDRAVRYDKAQGHVVEIEFEDNASAEFDGIDLFADPYAFYKLLDRDGKPMACAGAVVLLDLGMSLWNMERRDNPRTICLFRRGRLDELKPRFVPYQAS